MGFDVTEVTTEREKSYKELTYKERRHIEVGTSAVIPNGARFSIPNHPGSLVLQPTHIRHSSSIWEKLSDEQHTVLPPCKHYGKASPLARYSHAVPM